MADTKISALTAVATPAGTDEFPVNQGGVSKKMDLDQILDYIFPKGLVDGGNMANGIDSTNDIAVQPFVVQSESGAGVLKQTTTIVKQIDAAWAVGTNAGGLNTGVVANGTWYEVIAIKRTDTGVVDVMFSTTANRNTLPTNYTLKARLGWVRRGTATNLLFTQVRNHFTLLTPINDVAVAKTTTATVVTLTVPPNCIARFRAGIDSTTTTNANAAMLFRENTETSNPDDLTGNASLGYADLATWYAAGHFELRVSSVSQITHDAEVAQGNLDISTFGWIDDYRGLATP